MHSLGGGLMTFYQGFEANLISRLSYLAIRNTLYKLGYNGLKPIKPSNDLSFREKAVLSGTVGGIAAYLTTPFTIISIRQILDTQIKPEWRRNYTGVSSALQQLKTTNSQFKGSWANVIKHVALNVSLTSPFDYFNEGLYTRFGDYDFVKPTALLLAAICSSFVTLPFDNARTKIMNSHSNPQRNRVNYKNYNDVFKKIIEVEGNPKSLWAGLTTYICATYLYAWLTVGITDSFTSSWKRKEGLIEWQV